MDVTRAELVPEIENIYRKIRRPKNFGIFLAKTAESIAMPVGGDVD